LAFFQVVFVITVPISLEIRHTARRFVVRVLALALVAVGFHNFRTTTVAFIEITRFVIVFVITIPVAHVVRSATCWCFVIRVLALALFAVGFHNFKTTTVAFIEITRFVIVFVITIPVAHVVRSATCWCFVIRVQALALFAVSFFDCCATAVPTVPITGTDIVVVIAIAVPFVLASSTRFSFLRTVLLLRAIKAFALFAIGSYKFLLAAVATVPGTSGVVVVVVAITVAFVLLQLAILFGRLDASVARRGFCGAIFALALFAVLFFNIVTTAVATVPGTCGVIIVVVTIAIAFEIFCTAMSLDVVDALVAFFLVVAVQTFALFAIRHLFIFSVF